MGAYNVCCHHIIICARGIGIHIGQIGATVIVVVQLVIIFEFIISITQCTIHYALYNTLYSCYKSFMDATTQPIPNFTTYYQRNFDTYKR